MLGLTRQGTGDLPGRDQDELAGQELHLPGLFDRGLQPDDQRIGGARHAV